MLDRTCQPPIQAIEFCNLLNTRQFHLNNGIVFHLVDNPSLNLIHLNVRIKAGAVYEPKKRVSSFCYQLLKESHPTMNANEVADFLDFYGTSLSVTAGVNSITLGLIFQKKDMDKIVPFFADLLCGPVFRSENLERHRAKAIKDFEYNRLKVGYWNTQLMFNSIFGDLVPFGKLLEVEDLKSITLEDIRDYFAETCCAENITLFATGNLEPEKVEQIQAQFGRIAHGKSMPTVPDIRAGYVARRIEDHLPNALQTSISFSCPVVPYNDAEMPMLRILNTVFANYFGSRLMQNLRERNGYTYGVSGGFAYVESGSIYYIDSEVNNDKVEDAIAEIYREMELLRAEEVGEEEMETVRNYLLGTSLTLIDGTVSYLDAYMLWVTMGCDESCFVEFVEKVRTFSAADLRAMAEKYLRRENFTVITVGE